MSGKSGKKINKPRTKNKFIKDRERLSDSLFYNSEYWDKVEQEIIKTKD